MKCASADVAETVNDAPLAHRLGCSRGVGRDERSETDVKGT